MHHSLTHKAGLVEVKRSSAKNLKRQIRKYYELLYEREKPVHLPIETGKELALSLGYPEDLIRTIPEVYWDHFHPCGNPLPLIKANPGGVVLNLGCGIAVDSIALSLASPSPAQIINLDAVSNALELAFRLASHFTPENTSLSWVCGDAGRLPFKEERFDCVFMNGVFNLFPNKGALLGEVRRIMKHSACLVITDLCCEEPLPEYFYLNTDAWAWCLSGAYTKEAMFGLLRNHNFETIVNHHQEERDMFYRAIFSAQKR